MSRSSSNSQNRPNREKIESFQDDDFQSIMNSIINEEYIRRETGADDIEAIIHLNLVIDTVEQSVFELSEILPNLKHLILDHSNIASIRDLGIGLRFLTSLSLSSCSLYDIDGIGVLTGLQELCLSDNYLTDVTPLAMHENIQNLNLSGNKIADISVGDDLSSCAKLKTLFLQRNPISKIRNYRLIIPSLITGLVMLDGTRVDPSAVKKVTHGMMLEAASELRAIDEDIDDEGRLEQELSMQLSTNNNNNNYNLKHSSKQQVLQSLPPSRRIVDGAVPDTGSELTHGSSVVLAGNMAAAVRRRRQLIANASSEQDGGGIWDNRSVDRHESTIELLDAALHRSDDSSMLGDDRAGAFLREGDVTSSLMGSAALFVDSGIAYDEDCSFPQLDSGRSRQGVDSHKHLLLAEGLTRTSSLHPTAVSMDTSFEVEYRPRSANSFLRVSGGVPHESTAPSTGTLSAQQSSQSQSPRQRNSSRPTTAAAMTCETPRRGTAAFAVPFKVDINASTTQPGKSMKQQKQQLEELDGLDSIDLEDESKPSSWAAASLVHLDIVKRKILTGHHSMHGDAADEEDICLTHADRHKLMSSSAVRSDANSATANMKSRQHVLQQLKGTVYQGVPLQQQQSSLIATHHRDPSVASSGGSMQTHAPSSSRNCSNSTASSKAGILLGFHLAGSLAAIDKWVEEVDEDGSDDDDGDNDGDDDDDDQSQCAMESYEDTHGSSSHLKSQLLYSFASIPVLDIAQKDDQTPSNSNSSQKPACKILSRDAIMNMCSNSSGSNTSRVAADHDSDSDGELQVLSEEEEEASGHGAKTSETNTAVPIASSSSSSSSSTTHSMNQRLFTGNSIGRIRPLTKPREEEVRQVSAADGRRAKHLMAPGAVDPVSRTGADHTSSVADRYEKGGTKLVLLSKQQHGAVSVTGRPISDVHAVESNWDDDNSPPRFTHDPNNNNDINPPSKSSGNLGGASLMSDHELVDLLRRPPKSTLVLRTKSNFQQFFRGVDRCRMQSLLARAYEDIADASERSLKIKKRLGLLDDSDA